MFLLVIHGIFCLVVHVDLILISLSVPDDVPVSLHTFHHSSVHVVSHSWLLLTIIIISFSKIWLQPFLILVC